MSTTAVHPGFSTVAQSFQAVVTRVRDDGLFEVRSLDPERVEALCEVLLTPDGAAPLFAVGDRVLVLPAASEVEYACILGRVGRSKPGEQPRRIEVNAGEELVLRCGKGSITLRADGKVAIRGIEVASTAARSNRIKGGSVEIN